MAHMSIAIWYVLCTAITVIATEVWDRLLLEPSIQECRLNKHGHGG